jgi:hypothetical protein
LLTIGRLAHAGCTLVVDLLYLAEGAVRRNALHHGVGT